MVEYYVTNINNINSIRCRGIDDHFNVSSFWSFS